MKLTIHKQIPHSIS
uniref:Uncharacterized protein n=1 Tax=Arundo donax TaxID=35708 RepID=A0A0A9U513_ARUDO